MCHSCYQLISSFYRVGLGTFVIYHWIFKDLFQGKLLYCSKPHCMAIYFFGSSIFYLNTDSNPRLLYSTLWIVQENSCYSLNIQMQFNKSKLIVAQSLSFIFLCFSHLTCFLCYFLLADNTPYFKFMIRFQCLVIW